MTQQSDVSADLVVHRLQEMGCPFVRLNCERLLSDVQLSIREPEGAACFVDEAGERADLRTTRAIWYRSPQLPAASAELSVPNARFAQREAWAHVLGLLMSIDAWWMSNPAAIWRANQKVFQLAAARRAGLRIPRTCITRSPEEAWSFIRSLGAFVIAKPVTYGNVEGTTPEQAIYTTRVPADIRRAEVEEIVLAPVILQEEIAKRRDVRVTVIGRELFAVGIESQAHLETTTDWRRPLAAPLEHVNMDLPADLRAALCEFVHELGLDFGAIDLVETPAGEFYFLEINPNGQWGWLQLRTGLDLAGVIAARLAERSRR
ncbi:MAG TPA: hypothetical protein VGG39_37395 [Polyangiaceae bacterium]